MTDWELLVPGIGRTVLGMTGVGLSLAGIAKTFLEGMHAVSALMMFVCMILLATGILKDGLPNSNQAKAAAVIIIGLIATFGAFIAGFAEVPIFATLTGILFLILVPAVVIAWTAHIKSPHFKAITILFSSASIIGVITFSIFGFIAPQPIEAGIIENPEVTEELKMTGSIIDVTILEGSSVEGSQAYEPEEFIVEKGITIVWVNNDAIIHTVTSGTIDEPDFGKLFDSTIIKLEEKWSLDTSKLKSDKYVYFCTFHPFMTGKFTVSESGGSPSKEKTSDIMTEIDEDEMSVMIGSANKSNPEFYLSDKTTIQTGMTIIWINSDTDGYTVINDETNNLDTWIKISDITFPLIQSEENGEYSYFHLVHPRIVDKVIVT